MVDQAIVTRVRSAVYRHTDGIALGTTMAALSERGALDLLARAPRVRFEHWRRELDANAGFLRVATKLLANQGWLAFRGPPDPDRLVLEPTVTGRCVFADLGAAYRHAVGFLPHAEHIGHLLEDGEALGSYIGLMRRGWELPTRDVSPDVRKQVQSHLDGHLLAPLMLALTGSGVLRAGADIALDDAPLRQAIGVLAWQKWVQTAGNSAWLTPDGEIALACARQYRYPLVYLPLLRSVPRLLFGDPQAQEPPGAHETPGMPETHLDRALDVRFSGDVFTAVCRRPFLAMALPMFDTATLKEQPAAVVDTGCGDGTVLIALYAAVRDHTRRGRALDRAPLLMVGVDPSPVARKIASARMAAAGVPHVVLDGDIGDPARLRRALAERGVDASEALHVCKSAIHDRSFRPPAARSGEQDAAFADGPPPSYCAYALPDGSTVSAADIALSLTELFRSWRPLTRRHGWLVIEGHATPAAVAARLVGATVTSSLDSTHGYSCQYPVEPRVFEWAARAAGFTRRRHAAPGAAKLGHTTLTVDHFVVEAPGP